MGMQRVLPLLLATTLSAGEALILRLVDYGSDRSAPATGAVPIRPTSAPSPWSTSTPSPPAPFIGFRVVRRVP